MYPLPADDPVGTDLRLNPKGDLLTTMSGSLDTVSNEENAAQSVRTDVTTLPYTYLWGTDVGTFLAQYVDAPITDEMKMEIKNIVFEKAVNNDRITQVIDITVENLQDGLLITVEALVESVGIVQIPILIRGDEA